MGGAEADTIIRGRPRQLLSDLRSHPCHTEKLTDRWKEQAQTGTLISIPRLLLKASLNGFSCFWSLS